MNLGRQLRRYYFYYTPSPSPLHCGDIRVILHQTLVPKHEPCRRMQVGRSQYQPADVYLSSLTYRLCACLIAFSRCPIRLLRFSHLFYSDPNAGIPKSHRPFTSRLGTYR